MHSFTFKITFLFKLYSNALNIKFLTNAVRYKYYNSVADLKDCNNCQLYFSILVNYACICIILRTQKTISNPPSTHKISFLFTKIRKHFITFSIYHFPHKISKYMNENLPHILSSMTVMEELSREMKDPGLQMLDCHFQFLTVFLTLHSSVTITHKSSHSECKSSGLSL